MKKSCVILIVAATVFTACQQKPATVAVDITSEKAVIDSIFNKFESAFSGKDVTTLASYLTEDALCLGTDPSEFLNKQQITEAWTQMLADSAPEINFLNKRAIKVEADGNSAFVVDQYIMPDAGAKLLWRNAYQLVKTNNEWKISVLNCSFILKNEDIPKLNKALE
jgi:ketosteroid isomerase-like protein